MSTEDETPIDGAIDPRNTLNDLTGREWTYALRSVIATRYPTSGAEAYAHALRRAHPSPKPPQLLAELIRFFTKRDARVLDAFSYVGAWGIRAALGGAKSVVCVDASADAVRLGALGAAASGVGERVRFERADAFDDLAARAERGERYDLVVLDPPAFVKSRRKLDEGMRGYRSLNRLGFRLVAPGGLLATSSCSRHVETAAFIGILQAAADDAKCSARILALGRQAPDHPIPLKLPEAGYLDCVFLEVGP